MAIQIRKAQRHAVPMLVSISGPSGGGKTFSALLFAAGLAGPNGRVGMLDTENGRGEMYTDSPGILKALPNGFEYGRLDPPFGPDRYMEAISDFEKAGVEVLVVDSTSHEWEGTGGCTEIAETQKRGGMPNWATAKMKHKRFVNHCLSSKMHIIFCLRARDKVKIVKVNGKDEVVPIGIQPICEKNFVFEMLLSLQLDEATKNATAIKVPEPLVHLFPGSKRVTIEDGAKVREWNDGGRVQDEFEQVKKRARLAAESGTVAYQEFFKALTNKQKSALLGADHDQNKARAAEVDAANPEPTNEPASGSSDLDLRPDPRGW